jgi:hypothetical protein
VSRKAHLEESRPPSPRPRAQRLSQATRECLSALPPRSRKPGGARREGQRSGSRKVPIPTIPVIPDLVLSAFRRTWASKYPGTGPWRMRGLAVIAVAMSANHGTTVQGLCGMLPVDILELKMPRAAWKWVMNWLHTRRAFLGSASDSPAVGDLLRLSPAGRSKFGWAACQTLHRAQLPGWRVSKLLEAGWLDSPSARAVPPG